jgi:hypothetical protein
VVLGFEPQEEEEGLKLPTQVLNFANHRTLNFGFFLFFPPFQTSSLA